MLYAGNTLFADDSLTYLQDHWADLPRIVAAGVLLAAYFALIALAIASLTSRRALATGAYVGVMLASQTLAGAIAFGVGAGDGWLLVSIPRIAHRLGAQHLRRRSQPPGQRAAVGLVGTDARDHGDLDAGDRAPLPQGRDVTTTLAFDDVSKWYGDTVAVASLTFSLSPGVTGLLGHNGAGKSTALKLCAGFATPSMGTVRVLGHDPRREPEVFRKVGVVPDVDGLWPFLSAREVIRTCAQLRDVADPGAATERVLGTVELTDAADRAVGGFSKGMRQRVKLACALVHDPELLLLDEPLNGTDPAQRRRIVELTRQLGEEGRTVLVSSHVLDEVERMAPRVVVLVNGRLVAEGDTHAIRELLRDRPRTVRVASDSSEQLAQALIGEHLVGAVRLAPPGLELETADVDALGRRLVAIASERGIALDRVEPIGDDLESVYAYLTERARGRGR